ncbi:hypothetical protein Taro_012867 [Colocasia esculenta]|uniref:Transposase (putative) gypsy type domain-containing protein n=1 Tax=Colocasia esculenta TaxID=4460 RepID=A0A843UE74_COLES|nr:hypothetical protein [Colocasia esculenta]
MRGFRKLEGDAFLGPASNFAPLLLYKERRGRRREPRLRKPFQRPVIKLSCLSSFLPPSLESFRAPLRFLIVFFLALPPVCCSPPRRTTLVGKGKVVARAGASRVTVAASSGPRCRHYSGLRERFRIGDEYEIVDAKEGESFLVNKPGCFPLSMDHLKAGFQLPLPEVAKALLNCWGVSPIQLMSNTWRYICIFGVICKIKEIRGSTDVFRAHFKLSASRPSGADIYYAKHRTDRMHIQLSNKYSNNKGWMDKLFFVRRRDGAEWGFPTVVRSARKDSFPKLIQDEARASDSLLRAGSYVMPSPGALLNG